MGLTCLFFPFPTFVVVVFLQSKVLCSRDCFSHWLPPWFTNHLPVGHAKIVSMISCHINVWNVYSEILYEIMYVGVLWLVCPVLYRIQMALRLMWSPFIQYIKTLENVTLIYKANKEWFAMSCTKCYSTAWKNRGITQECIRHFIKL